MQNQNPTQSHSNLANTVSPDEDSILAKSESKCSSLFDKITAFTSHDAICRANCLLCNHPIRAEAEEKYEQTHSFSPVNNLLIKYRKEHPTTPKIGYDSIRNHINKHYKEQEKKWALQEYAAKHNEFLQIKINQDERFQSWIEHLDMKLWEVASKDGLDTVKQVEAMTKLTKAMLDVYAIQHKLRNDLDAFNILSERFSSVWLHVIRQQNNPIVKQQILEALDSFQENIQSLQPIEE